MGLIEDLQKLGIKQGYDRYVVALEPVLEAMSRRGMPVSPGAYAKLRAELETLHREAFETMQTLVPGAQLPFTPKLGYKKPPKGVDTLPGYARRWFPLGDLNTREERWVKLAPWKPSIQALTRYAQAARHEVPRDWKTGKVTFDDDELTRLINKTRDWLYITVQRYRKLGMYVNNFLPNWEPAADARVHPIFYYDTGTGQLASRRPNVQNAPKHGDELQRELADKFRGCVEAPDGYQLVECDYKSFHVHTLAFEAQDAVLMRMARLDVHSFVTAHLLRLPGADACLAWDDEKLGAYLAGVKREHREVRDAKVKHAFLGYDNGMGYRKLYFQYREFFSSQGEAKRVMELFDSLFPRAREYRDRICRQAHEQGYLISRFGCIRWFWEVFKKRGKEWDGHGEDHEAALSFLTQNDAHCHLKEAMLRLEARGVLERAGCINTIHDSLLFLMPTSLVHSLVPEIAGEMERPSAVLVDPVVAPRGLSVPVSVSGGRAWNKMSDLSLNAVT